MDDHKKAVFDAAVALAEFPGNERPSPAHDGAQWLAHHQARLLAELKAKVASWREAGDDEPASETA